MKLTDQQIKYITNHIAANFPSFGGDIVPGNYNPISIAMVGKPPVFAAGVDIAAVVRCVAGQIGKIEKPKPE